MTSRSGSASCAAAIEEPLRQIARNAGAEGSIVVERVRGLPTGHGFNAQSERYESLIEAGVIDPTKVVRSALQHAASVSGLMLTTEALIAEKPKKPEHAGASAGAPANMDF